MINIELLKSMKGSNKYDLPILFGYKSGAMITKYLKDSGLDLSSLKPYKELSAIEVKLIAEKGNIPQGKRQDIDTIVAYINGEEVKQETIAPVVKKATKVVKSACGGNCTCNKDESFELANLRKQVKELEIENKSLKLIAKVFNKEEFEKMKIENS